MKLTVKKDDLLKTLNHVQSVVERRNAVPILSNAKLSADKQGKLTITTTDMDMAVRDTLAATVETAGETTVPAHTLFEIIRKVENNVDVVFSRNKKDNSNIDLKVGNSEFSLPCLPAEDFPNFEVNEASHSFTINSEVLKTLFAKTRHAISNEETRYYLNGVYLHALENEEGLPVIRTVATDGHRLAKAEATQPEGADSMPGIIVPKKAVSEVIKLLEDYVGDVNVGVSTNRITFSFGDVTLHSKLIDGKYPDYNRVIPKDNDKELIVSRDALARAIDLVISVSSDKTRAVRLNISADKISVYASSEMNANAKGEQEIDAKYSANDNVTIGFNSRYVLDSLGAIDGANVRMKISSGSNAVIAQDEKENNCMYILMPMQV
ncbi:MAG: DNA polymerase III subunit beta [Rickettsiales bacterium]